MTKQPDQVKQLVDDGTEVKLTSHKRFFTKAYKAQIVAECTEAAKHGEGQVGAILRREGLYSSHLSRWKKAIEAGLDARKPGRPKKSDAERELQQEQEQLRKENERLTEQLRKAQLIIEAQKKLSELLANLEPSKTDNSE